MAEAAQQMIREAVGVFHDRHTFQSTVDDLMSAGFDLSELSLLAGERAIEDKLGHAYRRVQELEDDPTVPRAVYVSNHSLAEGRTGVIGGRAARFLGRERARELQHQLDHGGLLLWVYVRDQAHEQRAIEILTKNGAEDVHVHDLPGTRDPADNPLTGVELDPFLPDA